MKLKELESCILEQQYTVFVTIGGCDTEMIEVDHKAAGIDWLHGYQMVQAYGDSEVTGLYYNPNMGQIVIHAKADRRKEIRA